MNWLMLVCVFVVILGAFVFASVKGARWKIVAVAVFLGLVVTVFGGAFELLGKPKPVSLEFRDLKGSTILAYTLVENVAIYLWIDRDGQPMTIVLPWSTEDAQNVQDAVQGAAKMGGTAELGPKIDGLPEAPDNGEIAKIEPPKPLEPKQ
jgi:hypothetical protein